MSSIKFTDSQHASRMVSLIKQTGKVNETTLNADVEYGTAAYLLSANEDIYRKAKNYVSTDGIDFRKMMIKQDFSSGEKTIVKLAANLFNGSYKVDTSPISIIRKVDDELFEIAMCAIKLRHGGRLNLRTLR